MPLPGAGGPQERSFSAALQPRVASWEPPWLSSLKAVWLTDSMHLKMFAAKLCNKTTGLKTAPSLEKRISTQCFQSRMRGKEGRDTGSGSTQTYIHKLTQAHPFPGDLSATQGYPKELLRGLPARHQHGLASGGPYAS